MGNRKSPLEAEAMTVESQSIEDALAVLRWRVELTDKAVGREYDLIGAIVEKARDMMVLCNDLLCEIEQNGVSIDNHYMAEDAKYMGRIKSAEVGAVMAILSRLSLMDR